MQISKVDASVSDAATSEMSKTAKFHNPPQLPPSASGGGSPVPKVAMEASFSDVCVEFN